jgi:hypothetical protein
MHMLSEKASLLIAAIVFYASLAALIEMISLRNDDDDEP